MAKPTTIDEYIAALTPEQAERIEEFRRLGHSTVPDAEEAVKWGHPAIVHPRGTILFVFSAHAKHASIAFTPSTREHFDAQLTDFDTGKGSLKLPYTEELPSALLKEMMSFRLREFEDDGVLWM
ncbi:MAG TPA: DUF1801 domain-containing protein [Dietzia timorensis]|uniref:DUF1801 domain-containing protein n=1 Tax=Dietzia timorensis TaxID=499555 RepID=A0A921F2H5_9ACTN|nr:DUF1801 domain-containing protein [Dietzia timorensis]HJE90190.1 DUF1801 domain-containing protein [Dietzia timorensis]